jgi:hypothetical protein
MAQNDEQDAGPLTSNIVGASPWRDFSHEGGVVAVGKEPSFASVRCVMDAYNLTRGVNMPKPPPP